MTFKKYKRVKVFYDYSIYCCSATSNSEFFNIEQKRANLYGYYSNKLEQV